MTNKKLIALKNLINAQSDAINHMVDLITSKRRDLFSDEETTQIYIDLIYIDKAVDDLKESVKDGK